MDFKIVDERGEEEVEPKNPIKISLRELSEDEAKEALQEWTACGVSETWTKVVRNRGCKAWTFAILVT